MLKHSVPVLWRQELQWHHIDHRGKSDLGTIRSYAALPHRQCALIVRVPADMSACLIVNKAGSDDRDLVSG